ncbi:MAG: c-type cytochrome [Planctomycetota bacterium]|nr:c-type cytochrome [Planctomycetota bacterium]MDG1983556.1 c-type cytochrome [Planctomycetota bacterium]
MSRPKQQRGAVIAALSLWVGLSAAGCDGASAYADRSGEEIYTRLCAHCHGDSGRALQGRGGTYLGKRKYWTRESLLEYLDDPQAYKRKAPHLSKSKYMPPINRNVPEAARLRVADHVLGLMDTLEAARR